jgi:hypothetical protein
VTEDKKVTEVRTGHIHTGRLPLLHRLPGRDALCHFVLRTLSKRFSLPGASVGGPDLRAAFDLMV